MTGEALTARRGAVWRDPEFAKLWIGSVISSVGGGITRLAMPLIAIGLLSAGPSEMGVLGASGSAAFIVLGLVAGVIADRLPRRRVLIATNLVSVAAIGAVPLAAAAGWLRIELLYVVAFITGCCWVIGEVAFQALLPRLVGRDRLLSGNTLIRSTGSVTEIVGPSAAGVIIQILTAPVAIVLDAAGWAITAMLTFFIRVDEPPAPARTQGKHVWHDVIEGLQFVVRDPALRAIAAGGGTHNLFSNGAFVAMYILFLNQVLHLGPVEIGFAFALGGPGALVGSFFAAAYGRRFGMRATLVQAQIATGVARGLVPLAAWTPSPIVLVAAGEVLLGIARAVFNVNQLSLRQAMTPDHLQGRMSASIRFLMWSVVPVGALIGGFSAERIGLQPTMTIAAIGTTLAASLLTFVPANEK